MSARIVNKLANNIQCKINKKLDQTFDKKNDIDIFDYRRVLNDKYYFSYSRNTNCFYGLENVLKRYSGYKKELYVSTEHGVQLPESKNFMCVSEYRDNLAPVLLTSSKTRARDLRDYSEKVIVPIGSYIQYSEVVYDEEIMQQIKSNLGRTLLVFPQHSCENELVECTYKDFIRYIKDIKEKYQFDSVLVCIYFYDFIQGLHVPYEREGWTIVTAGHRQNTLFLDLLKTYISLSDHVLFQGYSSSVGYALSMGKPVLAYPYFHKLTTKCDERREDLLKKTGGIVNNMEQAEELYINLFCDFYDEINQRQLDWAEECISLSIRKTPEEMKEIFIMARRLYWNCFRQPDKIISSYGYSDKKE